MAGNWLVGWPAPATAPVLLCLPPAGAGCRQFGSWQTALGEAAQVVGVQLPGRENRWRDPMPPTVSQAVAEIAAEAVELVGADRPVVVFGHSFGGLLGYELARRLERTSSLTALVVSACRPPEHWHGAGRGIVDDEAELHRLFDTGGPELAALDPETRELMLTVLRRDAALSLSYTHTPEPLLRTPIHAWGGAEDDTVTPEQLDGWSTLSELGCHRRRFEGGHHAVLRSPGEVLPLLAALLTGTVPSPTQPEGRP